MGTGVRDCREDHLHRAVIAIGGRDPEERVPAVPAGWTKLHERKKDELVPELSRGKVHWLVNTKDGPTCIAWTLDAKQAGAQYEGTLHRRSKSQGSVVDWSFGLAYEPARQRRSGVLTLAGPHTTTHSAGRKETGGYRCAFSLVLAQRTDDALELLQTGPDGIIAYHPEDVQRWYLTPDSCESAKKVAERALSQDARMASRLGFVHGC